MTPPAFDDDLSFTEGVEDLAIEQLIAKAGVEALDVAVLPRTASPVSTKARRCIAAASL